MKNIKKKKRIKNAFLAWKKLASDMKKHKKSIEERDGHQTTGNKLSDDVVREIFDKGLDIRLAALVKFLAEKDGAKFETFLKNWKANKEGGPGHMSE